MRTAIFLSAILVRDAITNSPNLGDFYDEGTSALVCVFLVCFIAADIFQLFFRRGEK